MTHLLRVIGWWCIGSCAAALAWIALIEAGKRRQERTASRNCEEGHCAYYTRYLPAAHHCMITQAMPHSVYHRLEADLCGRIKQAEEYDRRNEPTPEWLTRTMRSLKEELKWHA